MDVLDMLLTLPEWNPLVLSIILLAILFPLGMSLLVLHYKRVIKRLKISHETNQLIIQKRMEAFEKISPKLFDMISFFCYTGSWKEISPLDLLRLKKELDTDVGLHSPLFSEEVLARFRRFLQLCFISSTGWEHSEKIKSLYELRQENNSDWKDEWAHLFDTKNVVDAITMKERYNELISSFRLDINLE